jgi:hypothetical protein
MNPHAKNTLATLAATTFAAMAALAQSPDALPKDPDLADPDLAGITAESKSHYTISAKYVQRDYDERHTALEHRYDYDESRLDNWEDGVYDGTGQGVRLSVAKDDKSEFFVQYLFEDYDYHWSAPGAHHLVDSDGNEFQIGWRQTVEAWEEGRWGWTVAYLRSEADKTVDTLEGSNSRIFDGKVEWDVVQAGYFGEWTPLAEFVNFFGEAGFRFGEAEGVCRRGNDKDWNNGKISEGYIDDSSLAYGAFAKIGMGLNYKGVFLDAAYFLSYLYSFDETDSGTVVFPDNDDALFIQNDRGFELRLGYSCAF